MDGSSAKRSLRQIEPDCTGNSWELLIKYGSWLYWLTRKSWGQDLICSIVVTLQVHNGMRLPLIRECVADWGLNFEFRYLNLPCLIANHQTAVWALVLRQVFGYAVSVRRLRLQEFVTQYIAGLHRIRCYTWISLLYLFPNKQQNYYGCFLIPARGSLIILKSPWASLPISHSRGPTRRIHCWLKMRTTGKLVMWDQCL